MPETRPPAKRITFWRTSRELLTLAKCPRHAEGVVTAFKLRALRTLGAAWADRAVSRIEALIFDSNDARCAPLHCLFLLLHGIAPGFGAGRQPQHQGPVGRVPGGLLQELGRACRSCGCRLQ